MQDLVYQTKYTKCKTSRRAWHAEDKVHRSAHHNKFLECDDTRPATICMCGQGALEDTFKLRHLMIGASIILGSTHDCVSPNM